MRGDPGRIAWLFLGVGLSCDAAGEILASISESLAPTAQGVLYLCFYLGAYVAIVLLGRRHVRHFHVSMWLDGLIGALAIGALGAAALATRGFLTPQGGGVRSALDVSYPLADVLLVGVVVTMLALGGWRVYRSFLVIALGFLLMAGADAVYLFQEAHGSYAVGTPLDSLWLLSVAILAYRGVAAGPRARARAPLAGRDHGGPDLCGLVAIGVLVYGSVAGHRGRLDVAGGGDARGRAGAAAGDGEREPAPGRGEQRTGQSRRAHRPWQPARTARGPRARGGRARRRRGRS